MQTLTTTGRLFVDGHLVASGVEAIARPATPTRDAEVSICGVSYWRDNLRIEPTRIAHKAGVFVLEV